MIITNKKTSPFALRAPSKRTGSILFFLPLSCFAILDYDRAILQTQKNNWPAAQELLTNVVIENPDQVDTLYDLGVAAYKNNNFDTALTYFNKAANHPRANAALQQQAHFNAGNTHVQLKQLQQAIDAYDKVLALKPDHEQALHNKEVVKKMMEEPNKDQQQNKDDQDKQEQKENDEKQKQDQNTKDNQDNKEQNQKQNKQEQKNENQNSEEQDKNKQNQQQQNQNSQESEKQRSDQSNKDGDKQDSADANQPSPKSSGGQEAKADKQQEETGAGSQPAQVQNKNQPEQKLSAGLARVLEDREKKDAQLNKKMTKALVANQGGGKHDYNCW